MDFFCNLNDYIGAKNDQDGWIDRTVVKQNQVKNNVILWLTLWIGARFTFITIYLL